MIMMRDDEDREYDREYDPSERHRYIGIINLKLDLKLKLTRKITTQRCHNLQIVVFAKIYTDSY